MAELEATIRKHIGAISDEQIRAKLDEDPDWLSKNMRAALRAYLLATDSESARDAAKLAAANTEIARQSAYWSMIAACAGAASALFALIALFVGAGE